jgi:hypothetical protein
VINSSSSSSSSISINDGIGPALDPVPMGEIDAVCAQLNPAHADLSLSVREREAIQRLVEDFA